MLLYYFYNTGGKLYDEGVKEKRCKEKASPTF